MASVSSNVGRSAAASIGRWASGLARSALAPRRAAASPLASAELDKARKLEERVFDVGLLGACGAQTPLEFFEVDVVARP